MPGPATAKTSLAGGAPEGATRASTWTTSGLKAGDALDVMTPTGRFGTRHQPEQASTHLGIAAGSGITPILSIVRGIMGCEPKSRFFLLYGSRSSANMLFGETL